MNYRDAKIIRNYANKVVELDKKQLRYEDWISIGKDITSDNERIKASISKRIVMGNLELANKAIVDLLLKNDIKPERALNLYKEAETIARNKENSGDLIKIADRYTELHDLKPQKVTISESRQVNSPDYDNLLKQKQTITVTKTANLSDNENKDL